MRPLPPRLLSLCCLALLGLSPAQGATAEDDPATWKWNDPRDLTFPGVHHGTIESASMGRTVGYVIYLPPQYAAEPARRFPVVFFLHGTGGTESSDCGLSKEVNAEVVAGSIDPVIYVFANGGAASGYRDWETGNVKAETMIVRELLPAVDRDYRTLAAPASRAICGFSMGGVGAIRLALKYPGLFGSAASLAAALDEGPQDHGSDNCYHYASAMGQAERDRLHLYMVVGDADFLYPRHAPFLRHLDSLGIRYTLVVHSRVTHNLGVYSELSARGMIEHLARELKGGHPAP